MTTDSVPPPRSTGAAHCLPVSCRPGACSDTCPVVLAVLLQEPFARLGIRGGKHGTRILLLPSAAAHPPPPEASLA